jgi:hypothetical protein
MFLGNTTPGSGPANVPEPASLLLFSPLLLLLRRTRKHAPRTV